MTLRRGVEVIIPPTPPPRQRRPDEVLDAALDSYGEEMLLQLARCLKYHAEAARQSAEERPPRGDPDTDLMDSARAFVDSFDKDIVDEPRWLFALRVVLGDVECDDPELARDLEWKPNPGRFAL